MRRVVRVLSLRGSVQPSTGLGHYCIPQPSTPLAC